MSAGLDPGQFWTLTFRTYDLHMTGAGRRIERQADMLNRHSWGTAAMTGAAMGGKLPKFEKVFRPRIKQGAAQSAEVLEANIKALAAAWGAKPAGA